MKANIYFTLIVVCSLLISKTLFSQISKENNKSISSKMIAEQNETLVSKGYAPVNNFDLYYEIHGEGKPLVLIHGGGSTIQTSFGIILPMLVKKHKVIAVELQAHGHTKDRDIPESFAQDASDVAALLRYLHMEKADILGFSNGAQTAMQMGISYPQQIDKLVLISAFYKREGAPKGFFDGFPNATLNDMPKVYQDAYMAINNDAEGLQRMFEKDKNRMLHFKGWTDEEIASIQSPSLIIAGDKDVVTAQHLAEMVNTLPHARLMILPGTHGSFIGEAMTPATDSILTELTVAVINDFLRN